MVTRTPAEVKGQAIARARERAAAENVHVEPMAGDPLADRFWLAQSSRDRSVWYTVEIDPEWGEVASCTCPAGQRGLVCKHAVKVADTWRDAYYARAHARVAAMKLTPEARRWAGLV